MDPREVQKAVKSLQQFLLDEYRWDTQGASGPPMENDTPPEPTSESGEEEFTYLFCQTRKVIISS